MHGPPLVGWLLVALAGTIGVYCLARARSGPGDERPAAAGEALMGLGMAVMAVPVSAPAPGRLAALGFAALFCAAGLRSALLALRPGQRAHHAHHAVGAAAMVYMALAMAAAVGATGNGHAHANHGPAGVPVLTGTLMLYFAAYALCSAPKLLPAATAGERAAGGVAAPCDSGVFAACRVSMGIGMFAMLLTL